MRTPCGSGLDRREWLRLVAGLLAAGTGASAPAAAERRTSGLGSGSGPRPLRILWLADPHLGVLGSNGDKNLCRAVREVRASGAIDAILVHRRSEATSPRAVLDLLQAQFGTGGPRLHVGAEPPPFPLPPLAWPGAEPGHRSPAPVDPLDEASGCGYVLLERRDGVLVPRVRHW